MLLEKSDLAGNTRKFTENQRMLIHSINTHLNIYQPDVVKIPLQTPKEYLLMVSCNSDESHKSRSLRSTNSISSNMFPNNIK